MKKAGGKVEGKGGGGVQKERRYAAKRTLMRQPSRTKLGVIVAVVRRLFVLGSVVQIRRCDGVVDKSISIEHPSLALFSDH